jgi:hypothetical protein
VPESLARVAIKTGMWKFLRAMVAATRPWAAARRARMSPFEDDANAVCRRTTGGADGQRPMLAAFYGHAGTEAHAPPEAAAGLPLPPGLAPIHPHAHDAARLHAVATAPGELQHLAAAGIWATRRPPPEVEGDGALGAWAEDASSTSTAASSLGSDGAGAERGMGAWMGWLPRGRLPPPRPAAPAPKAGAAPAAQAAAELEAPPTPPARAPAAAAAGGSRASTPHARALLPPSEALVSAEAVLRRRCSSGALQRAASPADSAAERPPLHLVLSDPGMYRPAKACDEGTQTPERGPWAGSSSSGRGGGALGGLAKSAAIGAAAGVAVLLLARAAEGGRSGAGGGQAARQATPRARQPEHRAGRQRESEDADEASNLLGRRLGGGRRMTAWPGGVTVRAR